MKFSLILFTCSVFELYHTFRQVDMVSILYSPLHKMHRISGTVSNYRLGTTCACSVGPCTRSILGCTAGASPMMKERNWLN